MPIDRVDLAKDSTMTKAAQVLANAIRKNAPYEAIRKTVRIGRREGTATSRLITVMVGKARFPGAKGAEYAAKAFDTGSGLHGKFGRTYTIAPFRATNLVFYWKRMNKYFIGRDGQTVQHPGVAGTNYMKRSKDESRKKIKSMILKDAVESIRVTLKADFRDFGK